MKKRYKWAIGTSVGTVAVIGITVGTIFGLASQNSSSSNLNSKELTNYLNNPDVKANLNAEVNPNVNLMVPQENSTIPSSYLTFPNLKKLQENAGVNAASISNVVINKVDQNILNNTLSAYATLTIKNGIGEATISNVVISGFQSNDNIVTKISSVSNAFQNNSFSISNTSNSGMELSTFESDYNKAVTAGTQQQFLDTNIKFNNQEIKTLIPNFSIKNFNISISFPANSFPLISLSFNNYSNGTTSSLSTNSSDTNNSVLSNIKLVGLIISPQEYQTQSEAIKDLNVTVKQNVQLVPLDTSGVFTSINFNDLSKFVDLSSTNASQSTSATLNSYFTQNLSLWEFTNINFLKGTVTLTINLNQGVTKSFNLTGFAPAQNNTQFQNINQAYQQATQVLESLTASDITADMYNLNVKNGINALNKPVASSEGNFWAANSSLTITNSTFQVASKEGLNLNINMSVDGNFELSNVPVVNTASGQLSIPQQNVNATIVPLLMWNQKGTGQSAFTTYTYPSFQTFYASQSLKVTNGFVGTQYSAGGNIVLNSLSSSALPPVGAKLSIGYIILQQGGVPNLSSTQTIHTIVNMVENANQNIGYLTFLENMFGQNATIGINNTNSGFNVGGVGPNQMTPAQQYASNVVSFTDPNVTTSDTVTGSQTLSNLNFTISSSDKDVIPTTPSTSTLSVDLPSDTDIEKNIQSFWASNSSLSNVYLINNLINVLASNNTLKSQFLDAAFNTNNSYINVGLTTLSATTSSNSNISITLNLNPQYSYNNETQISFNLNISNPSSPYESSSALEQELSTYSTSLSQTPIPLLNQYFTSIFSQYYGSNSTPNNMGNGGYSPFLYPIRSFILNKGFAVSVNSIQYNNGLVTASIDISGSLIGGGYTYNINSQNLNVTFNPILISQTTSNFGSSPDVYGIVNNTFGQISLGDLYSYSKADSSSFNNVNSVSLSSNPIQITKNTSLTKGFYLSITNPSETSSLIGTYTSGGNSENYYFSLPMLSMQYFAFQFDSAGSIKSSGYTPSNTSSNTTLESALNSISISALSGVDLKSILPSEVNASNIDKYFQITKPSSVSSDISLQLSVATNGINDQNGTIDLVVVASLNGDVSFKTFPISNLSTSAEALTSALAGITSIDVTNKAQILPSQITSDNISSYITTPTTLANGISFSISIVAGQTTADQDQSLNVDLTATINGISQSKTIKITGFLSLSQFLTNTLNNISSIQIQNGVVLNTILPSSITNKNINTYFQQPLALSNGTQFTLIVVTDQNAATINSQGDLQIEVVAQLQGTTQSKIITVDGFKPVSSLLTQALGNIKAINPAAGIKLNTMLPSVITSANINTYLQNPPTLSNGTTFSLSIPSGLNTTSQMDSTGILEVQITATLDGVSQNLVLSVQGFESVNEILKNALNTITSLTSIADFSKVLPATITSTNIGTYFKTPTTLSNGVTFSISVAPNQTSPVINSSGTLQIQVQATYNSISLTKNISVSGFETKATYYTAAQLKQFYLTAFQNMSSVTTTSIFNTYLQNIFATYNGSNSKPIAMGDKSAGVNTQLIINKGFSINISAVHPGPTGSSVLVATINGSFSFYGQSQVYTISNQQVFLVLNTVLINESNFDVYGINSNNNVVQIQNSSFDSLDTTNVASLNTINYDTSTPNVLVSDNLVTGFYFTVISQPNTTTNNGVSATNDGKTYYLSLPMLSLQYITMQYNNSSEVTSMGINSSFGFPYVFNYNNITASASATIEIQNDNKN